MVIAIQGDDFFMTYHNITVAAVGAGAQGQQVFNPDQRLAHIIGISGMITDSDDSTSNGRLMISDFTNGSLEPFVYGNAIDDIIITIHNTSAGVRTYQVSVVIWWRK